MNNIKQKHIVISIENYNNLKKLGNVGNSFNDVITELMKKRDMHD